MQKSKEAKEGQPEQKRRVVYDPFEAEWYSPLEPVKLPDTQPTHSQPQQHFQQEKQ